MGPYIIFFYFFQEKDALIRSYERQLRQKDEEIVSKEKKLQQLSLQLKEKEEELSRKEKEIVSKEEKLQQLSHQLSEIAQEPRRVKELFKEKALRDARLEEWHGTDFFNF